MSIFQNYMEKLGMIYSDIKWLLPGHRPFSFSQEVGEYFENDVTKKEFDDHNITFKSDDQLIKFLSNGDMKEFDEGDMKKVDNFERQRSFKDSKEEYNQSYQKMEKDLQASSYLALPMPTVIDFGDKLYLFAGNRRANFALNHDYDVKCWVVKAHE